MGYFIFTSIKSQVNIYMENTQQNPQPQNITVADLDLLRSIVDLATARGAFRASELSQVGAVYDKLSAFLEAIAAQAQAQEEANASAPAAPAAGEPQGE